MAISNLNLNCTGYSSNILTFNYSGSGTYAIVQVNYGAGNISLPNISPLNSANTLEDTDIVNVCNFTATYTITIKNSLGVTLETSSIACSNTCTPPTPPIDFTVDCNSRTSSGFTMTITPYTTPANQTNYTQLRIYRSTVNPTTITLPNPAHTLIATLPANTTSYTDITASANTQYWYQAEYYNSLSGSVSAKRTSGPCTTLTTNCLERYPLNSFEFNTELSDCSSLIITDLFNDNTTYKLPTKYACHDVTEITNMVLYYWRADMAESTAVTVQIGTFSQFYDPYTKNIKINLSEGVYKLKLVVTYKDSFAKTKTVTQSQCVFICGNLLCYVASLISNNYNNSKLTEFYNALFVLADCNKCMSALDVYNYIKGYDNCGCSDCDC